MSGNIDRIGNIGAGRLVLRPLTAIVLALVIPLSLLALACVAAGGAFIVSGQLVGLPFIALAIFTVIAIRALTGARLWADSEQVATTMWQQSGRCARAQLASMRIGPPRTRAGLSCNFVRTDGTVAFRVAAAIWGTRQLASLARFLGVPLVDDIGKPVDR